MNYRLITTDHALKNICDRACTHTQVALDTEFIRTRTYYPQLGLIQLYDGQNLSLIDPLQIKEWQPFCALLQNQNTVKFLHAASEDIEVFLNAFNQLPTPMIDSQILAAFVGHPVSSGFATLVAQYCHVELSKSETRTDWLIRPLSQKQCHYAAADVFYLLPLARQLLKNTAAAGWLDAVKDECALLCQRRSKILPPELAYREIANAGQLLPHQLVCLQKLAEWRLVEARKQDLAVNFVIREEHLWQIARHRPSSFSKLISLGLSERERRLYGQTLLALVKQANAQSATPLPPLANNLIEQPAYKKVFQDIKAVIQQISTSSGLSNELLASRRQINQLLKWHWQLTTTSETPELMTGWRSKLLAQSLREILKQY
ncbi:ribonuclease D [Candidatus Regiella insecticola 5.15]|uniref:Ribonuclease D n=1 Tax=Candidatus Regiella insecticola 5.15 TaxID=1005043 RepID=G2GWY5_9ENTR|nr:ribonuclease D [Candidatus Regiella insecticola]EGY29769.1 ribonuclease D [Candidatus Regiella insecticola 5.15]